MADKIYSKVMFYSNFPINSYNNQYYNSSRTKRNEEFDKYCNVKIDGEYKGQVEGVNVFSKLATINLSNITFRLQLDYKTAMNYNYGVLIQEDKRYYFFVDDIEWSSNLVTATVKCSCDWWQTYCYDITFKPSFVEREHVSNDTFGKHIIDEGLPISDYIIQNNTEDAPYNLDYGSKDVYFCIVLSDERLVWYDDDRPAPLYWDYGTGISLLTVCFKASDDTEWEQAQLTIQYYVENNKMESIQAVYYAPIDSGIVGGYISTESGGDKIADCNILLPSVVYHIQSYSHLTQLGNYVPKNNKTLCYPYSFVNISNYIGNSIKAKYEFGENNVVQFRYNFPPIQNGNPNGYLYNYDGIEHNIDNSISSIVNPEIPWISNTFNAYMAANVNRINNSYNIIERNYEVDRNIAMIKQSSEAISGYVNGVSNVVGASSLKNPTPSTMGAIGGFISSELGVVSEAATSRLDRDRVRENAYDNIHATINDMASKGDISHGSFVPNILTNLGRIGFQVQKMRVTEECAEMIDNYFSMFGYKINIVKTPQFNSRLNWNFVKTSSVNLIGNVPQIAIDNIKNMFNTGTTIWHDIHKMYDYGKFDNPIA